MVVDTVILIFMMLGIYRGYKKGFLKQLFSFLMIIIGYILSFILASRLFVFLPELISIENSPQITGINKTLSNLNIPTGLNKIIIFFILFFLIKIGLKLIFSSVGIVTKLPIIKQLNKLLGGILGFLEIYIVVFVIIYFLYIIPLELSWKVYIFESKIANFIFEETPILSESILKEFFNYK